MGFRSSFAKMSSALSQISDNKEKTKNPFARLTGSPAGKPEVLKAHYSQAVEKRRKARRKEGERRITFRRRSTETDDEDGDAGKGGKGSKNGAQPGSSRIGSVFGFIETHPDLPHILSFYAQLLLNVFLVFFFIYIIYSFWSTIRSDVDKKAEEAAAEILVEMAACAKSYRENKCDPSTRAPALEVVCNNWDKCMNKDAKTLGRAKISAHTFADIFNSFIEPISYKAMVCTRVVYGFSIMLMLRSRYSPSSLFSAASPCQTSLLASSATRLEQLHHQLTCIHHTGNLAVNMRTPGILIRRRPCSNQRLV